MTEILPVAEILSRWVVDEDHPDGHLIPYTVEELAQNAADQASFATEDAARASRDANAEAMRQSLRARMQDMLDFAALLDAGTATAAQQKQALSLSLKATVRLARLTLQLLDEAP